MAVGRDGFPDGFLWGGSVAAHQYDGAWDEGGKSCSAMDLVGVGGVGVARPITREVEKGVRYPSHDGVDGYHRYAEDLDLLSELGFTTLRVSLDWSRVFPSSDGKVNEEGLSHYCDVIDALLERGIEPIVTLQHFEIPLWVVREHGSWLSRETIELYLQFVDAVACRLRGRVRKWSTFNEMNHIDPNGDASELFLYMISGLTYADLGDDRAGALARIGYNMTLAGARAAALLREVDPKNEVGCVFGITPIYPATCRPDDVLAAQALMERDLYQADAMCRGEFPRRRLRLYEAQGIDCGWVPGDDDHFRAGRLDWLGVNYYASEVTGSEEGFPESFFGGLRNPYLEQSKWGWAVDPAGLRYVLNLVDGRYGLPTYVTENGLGAEDEPDESGLVHDPYRIEYLRQHIEAVRDAVGADGVDCRGYLMWAPIDLVSATTGEMRKRYGVIYVDKHDDGSGDLSRHRKDSFYWLQRVIGTNGKELS